MVDERSAKKKKELQMIWLADAAKDDYNAHVVINHYVAYCNGSSNEVISLQLMTFILTMNLNNVSNFTLQYFCTKIS